MVAEQKDGMRIPKVIHYCWFGGNPLSELAQKCIESWKKYCPDYEIVEWNESNFDIGCNVYVKEAYKAKKWAFVSDYARLKILYDYGGIYMDTDVEVVKPLDDLLQYKAVSGFETANSIPTGLMACEKGHPLFGKLLHDYDGIHFVLPDGTLDTTTNVVRITKRCLTLGLVLNNQMQTIEGFTLFPSDYFCPKDYVTNIINITENTYTIHHFNGSWQAETTKYIRRLTEQHRWMPYKVAKLIAFIKIEGINATYLEILRWLKRKNKPISM